MAKQVEGRAFTEKHFSKAGDSERMKKSIGMKALGGIALAEVVRGKLLFLFGMVTGFLLSGLPGAVPARSQQPVPALYNVQRVPARMTPAPREICIYRVANYRAGTRVAPQVFARRGPLAQAPDTTATIEIRYDDGFPEEAREALRRAADTWETHLRSAVPIVIDASYEPLGGPDNENVLANAGPTFVFSAEVDHDRDREAEQSVFSSALIDAIAGSEQNSQDPDASDIRANFNSSRDDWYFGDGQPGANQIDFESVALHEIAHGLGFLGSMEVEDGEGQWGMRSGNFAQGVPNIYDRFTEDGSGTKLINTAVYPNPSDELEAALEGRRGGVFFDGPRAREANTSDEDASDERPRLFAPGEWNQGSSYSHVDEQTYPAGDINALMSPRVARDEVVESPGAIVCGIFADIGWPLGPGCRLLVNADLLAFGVEALAQVEQAVELSWVIAGDSEVTQVKIQQSRFGDFQTIQTVPAEEGGPCERGPGGDLSCRLRIQDLQPGTYRFRLVLVEADGTETAGLESEEIAVRPEERVLTEAFPNPFRDRTTVSVLIPMEQRIFADLYDARGRRIGRVFDEEVNIEGRIEIDAEALGLASGVYIVRIVGEAFTEDRSVVLVQ